MQSSDLCKSVTERQHQRADCNGSVGTLYCSSLLYSVSGFCSSKCLKAVVILQELFELLQDESRMPSGRAPADILAVELTAGGLTPEHTNYVSIKLL